MEEIINLNVKPDKWYSKFYSVDKVKIIHNGDPITFKMFDKNIDNKEYWDIYNRWDFFLENNSYLKNSELLDEFDKLIDIFKENPYINLKECLSRLKLYVSEYYSLLDGEYLITQQLLDLKLSLELVEFTIQNNKNMQKIDFKFEYTEEDIYNLIRKEVKWRNTERDIEIYKEKQKGRLLTDIGKEFNLAYNSISDIVSKVWGAIGLYKGKLFEKTFFKYLEKKYPKFKVEWYGASGRPDIVIYDTENNKIIIYSLKNLEIKKRPYTIKKEKLRPELKLALNSIMDYKNVVLVLVVFNNFNNNIIIKDIEFRNPSDIII